MTEKNQKKILIKNEEIEAKIIVFRSNTSTYAQIVDIQSGRILSHASSKEVKDKMKKVESAFETGKILANKVSDKKFKKICFDRNGYKYHGRVKALAEGARSAGLLF